MSDIDQQGTLLAWAGSVVGRQFQNRRLILQAVTHPSHANEVQGSWAASNQRLEFLGDAVLALVVSRMLFDQFPDIDEGGLTRLRQGLVSEPTLAKRAKMLGIGEMLRLGRGEEHTGGRTRASNLADAFEAIVAALYLDGGLAAAAEFIIRELSPEIEAAREGDLHPNFKARLLERTQEREGIAPTYRVLAAEGPDHSPKFEVAVMLAKKTIGVGSGRSKRAAEEAAARAAWEHLTRNEKGVEK